MKCVQSVKFSLGGVVYLKCWAFAVEVVFKYKVKCKSVEHADMSNAALWIMVWRGERCKSQLLPNYILVLWVLFSSFVHVWLTCIPMHASIIPTFHFKLFALFWYCNTSNGAQRTRGWGGTLESSAQRLCSLWKMSTQKVCVAVLSWAWLILHEKTKEFACG